MVIDCDETLPYKKQINGNVITKLPPDSEIVGRHYSCSLLCSDNQQNFRSQYCIAVVSNLFLQRSRSPFQLLLKAHYI